MEFEMAIDLEKAKQVAARLAKTAKKPGRPARPDKDEIDAAIWELHQQMPELSLSKMSAVLAEQATSNGVPMLSPSGKPLTTTYIHGVIKARKNASESLKERAPAEVVNFSNPEDAAAKLLASILQETQDMQTRIYKQLSETISGIILEKLTELHELEIRYQFLKIATENKFSEAEILLWKLNDFRNPL